MTENTHLPYTSHVFQPKNSDYCAAVFSLNEGDRLHKQLERMKSSADAVDIVIADAPSRDGSTDPELLGGFRVNTLLTNTQDGGLGTQMRMAFRWALDRGYKGVVTLDGNNKDSVEDIPRFLDKLEQGYDHVQGSRFIPGGRHENTPRSRLWGLKLLHVPLLRLASGFKYTDTTNGFRAYSARFLSSSRVDVFRNVFQGYELHYYLAVKAARLGFRCIEVPVARIYPAHGKIPTKITALRGNLQVIQKLFGVLFGAYDP
jgi:dolichol-phosphate mannosyltransferase